MEIFFLLNSVLQIAIRIFIAADDYEIIVISDDDQDCSGEAKYMVNKTSGSLQSSFSVSCFDYKFALLVFFRAIKFYHGFWFSSSFFQGYEHRYFY